MDGPIQWREEQHQGTKYRASCDACNEAKVRCSRTKPTCTRCEKSRLTCIYGLSRRSNKTAPRVGCSAPSRQQQQAQQQQQQQQSVTSQPESIQSPSNSTNGNYPTPRFSVDFSEVSLDMDTSMTASPISAPFLLDPALPDPSKGSDFGLNVSDLSDLGLGFPFGETTIDTTFPFSMPGSRGTTGGDSGIGGCTPGPYSSRIVTKLASNPLLLANKGVSLDVQLSQLKNATSFAEECLQASTSDWDDMSPLAISMLVGSIITGFENSLEEMETAGEIQPSSPPQLQLASMQPQFTWGALHIDNEDELVLLKRHMWLIQFQRVDAVLQNLHTRTKGMKHEQMDSATAQKCLASNNIHSWLEQRTQIVKQKFSSTSGSASHSG